MVESRAVVIPEPGGPEVLRIERRAVDPPGPGQILVAVEAAGLNRADLLQRRGQYPAPPGVPADVPGLEYAGKVAARGPGAERWEVGAPVMGIVGGGAMATHLVVHEDEALALPRWLTFSRAAAVPEAFLTVWDALVLQAGMTAGDTVLIHAVGSGLGTAAVQLAAALGAHPVGTSRSAHKLERCTRLGLELGLHVEDKTFATRLLEQLGGRRVDIVLDTIGADYLEQNLDVLAVGGRIVALGLLGGARGRIDLSRLLTRRAHLMGSVLRARPLAEKISLAQAFAESVLPLFDNGTLRPIVDDVLPMQDVAAAHRRLQAGDTFGKLVLHW